MASETSGSNSEAMVRLDDKVAIITGASSGIGAGTAVRFAKLGAKLSLTGRNKDNLERTGTECQQVSTQPPLLIQGDMVNEEDVKMVVDKTLEKYGRIDILVNCAGIVEVGSIENTSLQQYDNVFNINVRSVYHLTMLCVPYLIKTKGNVVNVSSVNGVRSFPGVLSYCMSKSALDQFTKSTALELASKHVRVNSVNPGVIKTEIHKRGGMNDEAYAKFLEKCQRTHALGRSGDVEEVSSMIAFLASDNASFITGTTNPIDGGRHAMCNQFESQLPWV